MKGQKHRHPGDSLSDPHGLAILGHELGNVLHGLLGMAELLGESGLTPEQFRWLQAIEHSGRQMASLIRSAFNRYPSMASGIVPERGRVDGVELLEQVVISHTPAARAGNNRLILSLHPDLPRYWRQDACLVRQLLDNLVGNAVKFTRAGEIVVEAESVLTDGQAEESIRLRVSDTGPGVRMTVAEQRHGAVSRLSSAGQTETGNHGLGLYICDRIAEAMNGRITCSSPDGGGARFEVLLPAFPRGSVAGTGMFRSELLKQLRCRLRLDSVLGKCVANFLARLGVPHCRAGSEGEAPPGPALDLVISEVEPVRSRTQPCLLIRPCSQSGPRLQQRLLEPPLLESSLASLLLEIALEWRAQALRNESPGSSPKQP
jgi:hypothetical protein